MEQRTRKKETGLVVVGALGLIISAHFQMADNKEDAERRAVKVNLEIRSDYNEARVAFSIDEPLRSLKRTALVYSEADKAHVWKQTVIVPRGKQVKLIGEQTMGQLVFCAILYKDRIVDARTSAGNGQAICKFTPT